MTEQGTPPITTPPGPGPRKRTAPKPPSHWTRNITIGVIGIFVILAAVGSAASRDRNVTGPTAPPEAVASDEAAAEASDSASPTAGGTSLLSFEGTGPLTSDEFHASGTSIDIAYTYTCPAEDSFTLNIYGTNTSPILPDVLASEFGTTGADTANEPLNGMTGPFTLEVDSPCDWTVAVTGTP